MYKIKICCTDIYHINQGSKHFDLCGFGPVVPDGYGFWYNLLENKIDMNLTTRKDENIDNVKVFGDAIVKALNDLAEFAS